MTPHYTTLTTSNYATLHYTTLHYTTLLHDIALHCITYHAITLHYTTLHYIALHCITSNYILGHEYNPGRVAQMQLLSRHAIIRCQQLSMSCVRLIPAMAVSDAVTTNSLWDQWVFWPEATYTVDQEDSSLEAMCIYIYIYIHIL